jgi:hypothetical protein
MENADTSTAWYGFSSALQLESTALLHPIMNEPAGTETITGPPPPPAPPPPDAPGLPSVRAADPEQAIADEAASEIVSSVELRMKAAFVVACIGGQLIPNDTPRTVAPPFGSQRLTENERSIVSNRGPSRNPSGR